MNNDLVEIEINGPLGTPLGEFTALMFFSGYVSSQLRRTEYEGFPYTRNQQHGSFFYLKLSKDRLEAFLIATKTTYANDVNLYSFVEKIEQVLA